MSGTDQPRPPIPGTQSGTENDSDPTVRFHRRAMALNASRKGDKIVSASPPKKSPMRPGISRKNPMTSPPSCHTDTTHPARVETMSPTNPAMPPAIHRTAPTIASAIASKIPATARMPISMAVRIAFMAWSMTPLIACQMPSTICLMPSHTRPQSPRMRPMTTSMIPRMTSSAPWMTCRMASNRSVT